MFNERQKTFARKHWRWLLPVMLGSIVFGLYAQNIFGVLGGVLGIAWIITSLRQGGA